MTASAITSTIVSTTPAAGPPLSVEAQRAVRVLLRKSPATQRTYHGVYQRFATWLAARDDVAEASVAAFTSDALIGYLDELEARCSPATVKKERAALRRLARYLHQLGLIDATVVLMVQIQTVHDTAPARQGLDRAVWERVLEVAHERLETQAARGGAYAAARDRAIIQVLGGAGLRSHEARTLPVDPYDHARTDQDGSTCLRVIGKGNKLRCVPLYTDVADAIEHWRQLREQIPTLAGDPHLFARLGRRRDADGDCPDAGGSLSTTAVIRIVRPVMLAAGVSEHQAHPHTLRHTFGRLYMAAPGAELSRLQRIMGHASPETTSRYVHHADSELAAEHRRIQRLRDYAETTP